MPKFILVLPVVAMLTACVEPDAPTVAGATVGALAGAAIADDDDRLKGAVAGAVVGGVAGNLLGRSARNPDQCVYEDRYGKRYVANCP